MDQTEELLTRGIANILPSKEELAKLLGGGRVLNVYLGIDPTSVHIHLGHASHLRRLQKLAEMGHNVTFLIGDFTALIGDTSDKDTERPFLNIEEIEANWKTYKDQAEKLVDFSRITVRKNSEWLSKLGFAKTIQIARHFSLNDFISRELIKKRLESGTSVSLPEVIYPVMQGYDSYFMDTDIQLGGTDQTFNMQAGRTLQKALRRKESFVLVGRFLTGTDGRKMSKSWGNAIWLDDKPDDMFGKVMSVRDDLITEYFLLATNLSSSVISDLSSKTPHPMDLKKCLAWHIVSELHGPKKADSAQKNFETTFQQGQIPADLPRVKVSSPDIIAVLVESGLAPSKSAARRLIEQAGVQVNNQKVSNLEFRVSNLDIVRVGRRFVKITF